MAKTINEVLQELDSIILKCTEQNSALGFFPVLYRKVTARIKVGIAQKEFEDNARMEKLDVIFANRYLEAFENYTLKKPITASWQTAFNATTETNKLVLQHLLLGINAHINLDLGIAAAETVSDENLDGFKNDFDTINKILSELVDDVEDKIAKISPLFKWLDKLAGNLDEKLVSFSINLARDGAWKFAQEYYQSPDKEKTIEQRDVKIAQLALEVAKPKMWILKVGLFLIKLFESKNNQKIIKALT